MLQRHLQQQKELHDIITQVEASSKQINDIADKLTNEQLTQANSSNLYKDSLLLFEKRLTQMANDLQNDKQQFNSHKALTEKEQSDRHLFNAEELSRIRNEKTKLEQLQQQIQNEQVELRNTFNKEKIELIEKDNAMKNEINEMKNQYQLQLNEYEHQRKLFDEEKKFFENYKNETLNTIETKKMELEQQRNEFLQEESEIRQRLQMIQEKQFYFKEQYEKIEKEKVVLQEKENKIEKDHQDLYIAAKRIDDGIKALDIRKAEIDKERQLVMRHFDDIENEKININQQRMQIDQDKADVKLRLKSIDLLKTKYISDPLEYLPKPGNAFTKPNVVNKNVRGVQSNRYYYVPNMLNNSNNSYDKGKYELKGISEKEDKGIGNKNITANEYFNTLQNQLNNIGNKYNYSHNDSNSKFEMSSNGVKQRESVNDRIKKEQEYLRQSRESMDKSAKNDYEQMRKDYFSNNHRSLSSLNYNNNNNSTINHNRNNNINSINNHNTISSYISSKDDKINININEDPLYHEIGIIEGTNNSKAKGELDEFDEITY